MTIESARRITARFYSHFLCTDLGRQYPGVVFVCSADREDKLKGLGCKYPLYILCRKEDCIAAYSARYGDYMDALRGLAPQALIQAVKRRFTLKEQRLMIIHREPEGAFSRARVLTEGDFPLYEEFFLAVHPGADPSGWLREYFEEKLGLFTGCEADGRLVSVCEPPDMPYMPGEIQHTGINTLVEYRRRGFAREAAGLAARNLLKRGVCPQWDCGMENEGSFRLAQSVGYEEYGAAHILEERC